MSVLPTDDEIRSIAAALDDWDLRIDCQMPTLEELENDLALGNPSWKGLLRRSTDHEDHSTPERARGSRDAATWCETHQVVPDGFVCGYLKGRAVADQVAETVALEASKAFRYSPDWQATAIGRTGLLLRLHWALLEAGHTCQSSRLSGDLLKELLNRRMTSSDIRSEPLPLSWEEI